MYLAVCLVPNESAGERRKSRRRNNSRLQHGIFDNFANFFTLTIKFCCRKVQKWYGLRKTLVTETIISRRNTLQPYLLNAPIKLMVTIQHTAPPYAAYSSLLFSSHSLTELFSLYILAPTLRVLPVPPLTSLYTHTLNTQSLLTQAFPINLSFYGRWL